MNLTADRIVLHLIQFLLIQNFIIVRVTAICFEEIELFVIKVLEVYYGSINASYSLLHVVTASFLSLITAFCCHICSIVISDVDFFYFCVKTERSDSLIA